MHDTEKRRTTGNSIRKTMSLNRSNLSSSCNLWGFCLDAKRGCAKSQKFGLFTKSCIRTVSHYHTHAQSLPSWPFMCWLYSASVHVHNYKYMSWQEGLRPGKSYFCMLRLVFCILHLRYSRLVLMGSHLTVKMALVMWGALFMLFSSTKEVMFEVLFVCPSVW